MNVMRQPNPRGNTVASYSLDDVLRAFDDVALVPGSTVMMHSSLFRLGRLADVSVRDYPETLVAVIRDYLGSDGTLVVPAPNWDYGARGEPFDVARSPVTKMLGVVSAYMNGRPDRSRSANPIFSVAALGAQADAICAGNTANAFGYHSAWQRMFDLGADNLCFGTDFEFLTFIRYAETRFGVPYLYDKYFDVPLLDNGAPLDWPVVAPLRFAHLPIRYDPRKPEELCRKHGILRETRLGGGPVMAVRMQDFLPLAMDALAEDIHFFLAEIPAYDSTTLPRV